MAIITTDNQHYTDIANAIRSAAGSSAQYKPSEMAAAISGLMDVLGKSALIITAPDAIAVTCSKGGVTKTAIQKDGEWHVYGCDLGSWTVLVTFPRRQRTEVVNVEQFDVYRIAVYDRMIPAFSYTGNFEIVTDNDEPIADPASWADNWKIRLLSTGDFVPGEFYGFSGNIDVFLAGGGGGSSGGGYSGGAGGGYTSTLKNVAIVKGQSYPVTIGAGGTSGNNGGTSSAFGGTAAGGTKVSGPAFTGSAGGSGGGGQGAAGGSDGSNGNNGSSSLYKGGAGQGKTTREFEEPNGRLYCGGGGGGNLSGSATGAGGNGGGAAGGQSAAANTGGGAGGIIEGQSGSNGGSGIVVIRNAR